VELSKYYVQEFYKEKYAMYNSNKKNWDFGSYGEFKIHRSATIKSPIFFIISKGLVSIHSKEN